MLIDHQRLSLIVSSTQLQAVSRAGNLGTYIHLPIKLTNTIEEWDRRIPFLVCRLVC